MEQMNVGGGSAIIEEQIAGLVEEQLVPGLTRWANAEDSAADYANVDPADYHRLAARQVPPIIPLSGEYVVVQADYNLIANYELARSGLGAVEALGRNDQNVYNGTVVANAGTHTFTGFSDPNLIAALQVDWGVALLAAAPFDLGIQTSYFRNGMGWASVDRNVTVRVGSVVGGQFGGSFQIPFAQRMTSAQTCGYTAPAVAGGMQKAIYQPARIPLQLPVEFYDRIPPVGVASDELDAVPFLLLTMPPTIAASWSARCRVVSAGSPQLANFRDRLRLNGAGLPQGTGPR